MLILMHTYNRHQGLQNLEGTSSIYEPPDGFDCASIPLGSSSTLPALFSPSNLLEKQLLHFALPTTVPLKALEEVTMQGLSDHEGIFSYKGTDYSLIQAPEYDQTTRHILIPGKNDENYRSISASIRLTLQSRQVAQLSKLCTSSRRPHGVPHEANTPPKIYKKFVRQQPEGLLMRYRPFGDADETRR